MLTTAKMDKVIVTYPGTEIEDPEKSYEGYSSVQEVIATGDSVKGLEPGMKVLIDFKRYAVPVQKPGLKNAMKGENVTELDYRIPVVRFDGKEYLDLDDNDIKFVITESEEIEESVKPVGEA